MITTTDQALTIRVVLADGQRLAGERLLELCTQAPDLELLGLVTTAIEATERIRRDQPTVAVLDVGLWCCDLLPTLCDLSIYAPMTRLVLLVPDAVSRLLCQLVHAGATSLVLRSTPGDTLLQFIRAAARGEGFVPREVLPLVASVPMPLSPLPRPAALLTDLTPREYEILSLIWQQHSTRAIADVLQLSAESVKTYRKRIRGKGYPTDPRVVSPLVVPTLPSPSD